MPYPPTPGQIEATARTPGISVGTSNLAAAPMNGADVTITDPTQGSPYLLVTVCANLSGFLAYNIRAGLVAASSQKEYMRSEGFGRRP